ncbi:unnamed protein product [Somion occarium]
MIGLGGTPDAPMLKVPVMGFGAWAWGDVNIYGWGPAGGYDKKLDDHSVTSAFDEMLKIFSKVLIDSAEYYSEGYAEKCIGFNLDKRFTDAERAHRIVLATKFSPTIWRHPFLYPDCVLKSMMASLERTLMPTISIYQLEAGSHFGLWPRLATLADGLARCYETGKVKTIGTCNLNLSQIRYLHDYFKKRNVPYVSNQVELSLLRTDPWKSGFIEECRQLGIATIAYSPLGLGRLTGKYSAENPPKGNRYREDISWLKIQPIVNELTRIGEARQKTPGVVALNWVMCKGAIPIPSVKNGEQARDCAQAVGWRLTLEEEARLDKLGVASIWSGYFLKRWQN